MNTYHHIDDLPSVRPGSGVGPHEGLIITTDRRVREVLAWIALDSFDSAGPRPQSSRFAVDIAGSRMYLGGSHWLGNGAFSRTYHGIHQIEDDSGTAVTSWLFASMVRGQGHCQVRGEQHLTALASLVEASKRDGAVESAYSSPAAN